MNQKYSEHLFLTFGVPLYQSQLVEHEKLNSGLCSVILAKEKESVSKQHSNYGGWHSDTNLLFWQNESCKQFRELISQAVQQFIHELEPTSQIKYACELQAWANVNRQGEFNRLHMHPENHLSGVYYVQVPEIQSDTSENCIALLDPKTEAHILPIPGVSGGPELVIKPKIGMLLIFPSWINHYVYPVNTPDVTRISIAFNAKIIER